MTPHRSLNFVPPANAWLLGHATRPGLRAMAWVMLVLALLLVLAAAVASAVQRQALAAQREAAANRPRGAATAVPAAGAAVATVVAPGLAAADRSRINRVLRSLNTPWTPIFQALEAHASPQVAVLALESDAEQGAVRVLTEGPSLDALLAHAQRVQDATPFVRTRLLRIEAPDAAQRPAGQAVVLSRLSFDLRFVP